MRVNPPPSEPRFNHVAADAEESLERSSTSSEPAATGSAGKTAFHVADLRSRTMPVGSCGFQKTSKVTVRETCAAAGFAAASYHRGVAVIHVATTLLAQVDAAIGGKTGVNLPEGKNLVGAFWQPAAVLCDTGTLSTLPEREMRCGLGEVAKYHFLGGEGIDALPLDEQVAACVAIKAAVVAGDERESGRRAVLNYGHTLAHALEIAGGHDLRHGEAVAIGLVFAGELAHRLGRIGDDRLAEHRRVVAAYGLPSSIPTGLGTTELLELMGRDKKALDGLAFVLDGPSGVETVTDVDRRSIEAAIDAVREGGIR